MASYKTNDDLLRKSFDVLYESIDRAQHVDVDEAKHWAEHAARTNKRTLGMSLVIIALALFVIVGLMLSQYAVDAVNWNNRPTFTQRLVSPYGLESTMPPYLLNAVQVDAEVEDFNFQTANITAYPDNSAPESSQLLAKVVKLQSIIPQQIGDYTLLWNRNQSFLLSKCLLQSAISERPNCPMPYTAEFVETGNFINSNADQVSLVMTKFADENQSSFVFNRIYRYARSTGRLGNFSMTDALNIDYFYSATRDAISFTWINNNWVFTAASSDIEALDMFMNQFPLYENNSNLNNLAVEQISRDSGLNLPVTE